MKDYPLDQSDKYYAKHGRWFDRLPLDHDGDDLAYATCSKPKSEHKRANHGYERNTVLPEWHGWHTFRRGLATNLDQMGVDDLTIEAILRHSHVSVTQQCYIKKASSETKAAMENVERALTDIHVTPRQASATIASFRQTTSSSVSPTQRIPAVATTRGTNSPRLYPTSSNP